MKVLPKTVLVTLRLLRPYWTPVAFLLVLGLTVASGILHGKMSNRWGPGHAAQAAGERMARLPEQIGPWKHVEDSSLSETEANMLQVVNAVCRRYRHADTGEMVTMHLVIGPPGPLTEHTPEVCISSQAFARLGPSRRVEVVGRGRAGDEAGVGEFWAADFRSNDAAQGRLRVYYAWSTGRGWKAPPPGLGPGKSRVVFAAAPYLYKIQLVVPLPPGIGNTNHPQMDDPGRRFLTYFLPAAEDFLVEPAS